MDHFAFPINALGGKYYADTGEFLELGQEFAVKTILTEDTVLVLLGQDAYQWAYFQFIICPGNPQFNTTGYVESC